MISVIIPVYNVERYLEECISSVVQQTYRDLEIILVDDGSTDGSGALCDAAAEKDARIRVIHQENRGLSGARNTGLSVMTGESVFFLDSDDRIERDCLAVLADAMKREKADVAIAGFRVIGDKSEQEDTSDGRSAGAAGESGRVSKMSAGSGAVSREELQRKLLYQQGISTSAWGKLFRSELFSQIRFPEGKLFEDVVPIFQACSLAARGAIVSAPLYDYRKRKGSITKKPFTMQQMDYVANCRELQEYVQSNDPELAKGAQNRLVWAELYVMVHAGKGDLPAETEEALWNDIRHSRKEMIRDPETSGKVRSAMLLSYGGRSALRLAFRLGLSG